MKTAEITLAGINGAYAYSETVENVRAVDFFDGHVVVYREDDTLVAFRADRVLAISTKQG